MTTRPAIVTILLAISLPLCTWSGSSPAAQVETAGEPREEGADASTPDPAEAPEKKQRETLELAILQVIGQRLFPYQEGTVINREYIDSQVKGEGDIATLLRINPHVQFDDTASTSRNMGEIRPADISINGGLFYQNNFLLDGASFTNDLDPGSTNPNHFTDPPSYTQGIALDTELLESIIVYDSNVPASYGGFNGGVIDAHSRKARDELSGRVSYRMTRSAWNSVHINEEYRETFESSATIANQPSYDKYKVNAMVEGRTGNDIGLILNIGRTHSTIPLRGQSGGEVSQHDDAVKDQERGNTSASLRADWSNGRNLWLNASLTYAPSDNRYFIQNARDSWFDLKQGGPVASFRATLEQGTWTFRNTFSYSDLDSSRRSDVNYWYSWRWSEDKNWGTSTSGLSTEGNWGNIDQTNRNVAYKLLADRLALRWGRSEHRLQFGFEFSDREATYHRLNDHHTYISPSATSTCTSVNGSVDNNACSLAPTPRYDGVGQYLTRYTVYRAGYFEADQQSLAAFVQDDIRLGDWNIRPGVRIDHDDLSKQTTIAPRLALSWRVLGSSGSLLTAGLNRYYGRNIFAYKLREGRERLSETRTRDDDLVWSDPVVSTTNTRFSELDVPYSDELSLGFSQRFEPATLNLKYIHRDNRDEVLRIRVEEDYDEDYYSASLYEYRNIGRSRSDIYTLSLSANSPLRWGPSTTTLKLAFDYTDVRRNYSDYSDRFDDSYNDLVRYEGELIKRHELPADNFNRPWTARLATGTTFDALGLLWSNFLRYRAGYLGVRTVDEIVYEGEPLDVLEDYDYPASWTWDSVLEFSMELPRDQSAYVRVEITNLLDRRNLIQGTSSAAYYERGRSYWAELGYRF